MAVKPHPIDLYAAAFELFVEELGPVDANTLAKVFGFIEGLASDGRTMKIENDGQFTRIELLSEGKTITFQGETMTLAMSELIRKSHEDDDADRSD